MVRERLLWDLESRQKPDGRLLFPSEGAETVGPFATKATAVAAAQEKGKRIVEGDLVCPEL
ncbi:DUF6723 family protein [Caballeronia sp. LZ025]|uniref:DUF6723 family protein n=1 Tax=Caballeronia sp. LZ025 TaxID=3038562 RepID=UPI003857B13F